MFQLLVVCKALTLGLNANHEILGRGVEIYANNNNMHLQITNVSG